MEQSIVKYPANNHAWGNNLQAPGSAQVDVRSEPIWLMVTCLPVCASNCLGVPTHRNQFAVLGIPDLHARVRQFVAETETVRLDLRKTKQRRTLLQQCKAM
jgi:hypothetical protein